MPKPRPLKERMNEHFTKLESLRKGNHAQSELFANMPYNEERKQLIQHIGERDESKAAVIAKKYDLEDLARQTVKTSKEIDTALQDSLPDLMQWIKEEHGVVEDYQQPKLLQESVMEYIVNLPVDHWEQAVKAGLDKHEKSFGSFQRKE